MQTITTGLVLREVKLGEADKILTILSPELGVISASAKGSMRMKSSLFSACGLFCYSEFALTSGQKGNWFIRDAQIRQAFHGIGASVEGTALAIYLAELTGYLTLTGKDAAAQLRLLLNSLYLISEQKKPLWQVKAVYELRSMAQNGYMPGLLCCAGCSRYEGGDFYLEYLGGRLLCGDCARKEGHIPNLDAGALTAVRHICLAEDKKIFSFALSEKSAGLLGAAAEQYTLCQLDRPLKSLDFYHSVL